MNYENEKNNSYYLESVLEDENMMTLQTEDAECDNSNSSNENEKQCNYYNTGFKTGKNKEIVVDKETYVDILNKQKNLEETVSKYEEEGDNKENELKNSGKFNDSIFEIDEFTEQCSSDSNFHVNTQQEFKEEEEMVSTEETDSVHIPSFPSFLLNGAKRMRVEKNSVGCYEVEINHNQNNYQPIRRFNCPQSGHVSVKIYSNIRMYEIYKKCVKTFSKKMEMKWVGIQFKWAWMHFVINPVKNTSFLEDEILQNIEMRMNIERSIFKNIVEFDDIAYRYCVLAIFKVTKEYLTLFDGFYTLNCSIDHRIYHYLRECVFGTKLYVFGMQLLIKEPRSIFSIDDEILIKLSSNGTKICTSVHEKLGYKKGKISFLNYIQNLVICDGIVSSIVCKVEEVVEDKFLVIIDNYRSHVNDLEKEFEKVQELLKKANRKLLKDKIVIKKYYKLRVHDRTGSCLLTWWNPPEIVKRNEKYKFVYLRVLETSLGLNLYTCSKTYIKKLE